MNRPRRWLILIIPAFTIILLFSCGSAGYKKHVSDYQFRSANGQPDYNQLDYWAAHPEKKDPSDSVPKPLRTQKQMEKTADVFFIHPTTYTDKPEPFVWNAVIDDAALNAKTDFTSILFQASVFNEQCRVFAPRYRQAHLDAFFTDKKAEAFTAFNIAYADVKKAFEHYLKNENHGRPIILAAHSQGTIHAGRLLQDYFEKKPLQKQLVAAYIIGMPLPKSYFKNLLPCSDEKQTGCVAGWRTLREGFLPDYIQKEDSGYSYVINPLNWQTTPLEADAQLSRGAVLKKFNKIYKKVCRAKVNNNVLWISRPKFPFSFLVKMKNYHVADINLFYVNIRENLRLRLSEYLRKKAEGIE
jgi:hypothetical protein